MGGSLGLSMVDGCIDGVLKYDSKHGRYDLVPNYIQEGGLPASLYQRQNIGQQLSGPFVNGIPDIDDYVNGQMTYEQAIEEVKRCLGRIYRAQQKGIDEYRAHGWLAACVAGHSASYSVSWMKINPVQDPYDGQDDAKLGFTLCPGSIIGQTTAETTESGYFDGWSKPTAPWVSIVIWQTTDKTKPIEYFQQVYKISMWYSEERRAYTTAAQVHQLIVAQARKKNADPNANIMDTIDGEQRTVATATRTCRSMPAKTAKELVDSYGPYFCGEGQYALLTDIQLILNMEAVGGTSYAKTSQQFLGYKLGKQKTPVYGSKTVSWSMDYNNATGLLKFSYYKSSGITKEIDVGDPVLGPKDPRLTAIGIYSASYTGEVKLQPGLASVTASTQIPLDIDPDSLLLSCTQGGYKDSYAITAEGTWRETWTQAFGDYKLPDDDSGIGSITGAYCIAKYPQKIVGGKIQYQVIQYGVV